MMDGLLTPANTSTVESLEKVFVFCMIWAMGSSLTVSDDGTDYQKLFSDWWRSEWKKVSQNLVDDVVLLRFEPWVFVIFNARVERLGVERLELREGGDFVACIVGCSLCASLVYRTPLQLRPLLWLQTTWRYECGIIFAVVQGLHPVRNAETRSTRLIPGTYHVRAMKRCRGGKSKLFVPDLTHTANAYTCASVVGLY